MSDFVTGLLVGWLLSGGQLSSGGSAAPACNENVTASMACRPIEYLSSKIDFVLLLIGAVILVVFYFFLKAMREPKLVKQEIKRNFNDGG